ncbi:MAG: ubiA [Alphaproteobacteria bacterium]|nr:ubiA [Alphaproteobacteria bacterium]
MNAYFRLTRLDCPLGILLLYILPCWWGITLAAPHDLNVKLLLLFALGATLVRGAGCTFNDLIDRKIDAQVARTKRRPLASGELSPRQGFIFFCLQCLGGLCVLLYLPPRCWPLSLVELIFLTLYPFMKRMTYWPQLILGFAMNFGVIFGAVAALPYEDINWPATLSLYGAGIAWTVGYDTIYALQDKEDDLKIGVKSTAIRFGDQVKLALILTYGVMFALLAYVGYGARGGFAYYSLIGFGILVTSAQLFHLDPANAAQCQKIFAHPYLGWLVWGALLTL